MKLTSKDIVGLLEGGLANGQAMFHLSKRRQPGDLLSTRQRAFLEEVTRTGRKSGQVPEHPESGAAREQYRRDSDAELSAVELAWLDRLPRDPAQVRFEDAQRLAALAASISPMKAPQSARLIESAWAPVKALHDRRVAEAELKQAQRPLPRLPDGLVDALLDALIEEHPGVSREALRVQARELATDVQVRREDAYANALNRARRHVDLLSQAQADYDATTREVAV
ncbi:hypothetical protein [Nocardioides pyridinolyticus]